ncbi:hypothetical protein P43SY_009564 [Pythium insidiosum]|uniref:Essential protein Yae1 N-terminal domain-containing protein n=1 Tax=Pythium insidiosum TaxID=114742 RepID=A0AAD5LJ27_PYTIN|nr:hypothetical protein P43SY_009564 [Pythium insidiosum]
MSPVNANTLQTKIAQLPSLYTTVFNIANVPIPFNYMQYLQYLIVVYMTLYTFVIVPRSGFYTPLWVFFWGMFLFTADQVAMEIECPFGLDANDIDLEARLLQIEEELTLEEMDVTDAFDAISGWEEQLIAEGEELGIEHGRSLGVEEGRELGLLKGVEIGSEIGFYHGCFLLWDHMMKHDNIVDEDIMHKLLSIRAKFKVITALLGLKGALVFNAEDVDAHKNMSF